MRDWIDTAENQARLGSFPYLYMNDLRLTCVPWEIRLFTGLNELNLSGNPISLIPAGAFEGLEALHTLDLSFMLLKLKSLENGAFRGLGALTSLNLAHNRLTALPLEVFEGLVSLSKLGLGGNRISHEKIPPARDALNQISRNDVEISGIELSAAELSAAELAAVMCFRLPEWNDDSPSQPPIPQVRAPMFYIDIDPANPPSGLVHVFLPGEENKLGPEQDAKLPQITEQLPQKHSPWKKCCALM